MQSKFIKINDTYINLDEIRKIKYTKSAAGIHTYCVYLKDNSKEEISYPIGRPGGYDEFIAFKNWLTGCLLNYNPNNI